MSTEEEKSMENYFTEEQAAAILGITVATLRNRHAAGKDHPPKTPERRYPKGEFHKWMNGRLQHEASSKS